MWHRNKKPDFATQMQRTRHVVPGYEPIFYKITWLDQLISQQVKTYQRPWRVPIMFVGNGIYDLVYCRRMHIYIFRTTPLEKASRFLELWRFILTERLYDFLRYLDCIIADYVV